MRRFSVLAQVAALLVIFTLILAACGGDTGTTTPGTGGTTTAGTTATPAKQGMTVSLVTDVGSLNDNGFNSLSYAGYKKAMQEFGFPESVIQTSSPNDIVNNLTLAAQKSDLVIAVGFLAQAPLDQVAKQFPNKKFAIVDGCAQASGAQECSKLANVAGLFFKEQEAGCLVGAIAGQMELMGKEKSPKLLGKNTVGIVGGISIPPVNRYAAGFKYCAQKVNPNINVVINYSNDFTATAKCKDAALSQINQHSADIIFQLAGGCGVGALDAAAEKGVYSIGGDLDQNYLHPESVITSATKRVDTAVYSTIASFQKGQFSNNPPVFDLVHEGVGYATPSKEVPQEAAAKAEEFAKQIKDGTLVPPTEIPQ